MSKPLSLYTSFSLPPLQKKYSSRARKVTEVRSTAPKDAVQRVLDEKKWGKEKLCKELEELRAARKRCKKTARRMMGRG